MGRYKFAGFGEDQNDTDVDHYFHDCVHQDDLSTSCPPEKHALVRSSDDRDQTPMPGVTAAVSSLPAVGSFLMALGPDGRSVLVPVEHFGSGEPTEPRGPRWVSWQSIAVWIAVVAVLLQLYGPSSPPSNNVSTWRDFLEGHFHTLWHTVQILSSAFWYALEWSVHAVRSDVVEFLQEQSQHSQSWLFPLTAWLSSRWPELAKQSCPMRIDREVVQEAASFIVGQERAVSMVLETLHAWDTTDDNDIRNPLFILLSGTVGVGKMALASSIGRSLFAHCTTTHDQAKNNIPIGSSKDTHKGNDGKTTVNRMLIVEGSDMSEAVMSDLTPGPTGTVIDPFATIQQHVLRYEPYGSVVVIHHIEVVSPTILLRLQKELKGRVVVFATTHVGAKVIHRFLKAQLLQHYSSNNNNNNSPKASLTGSDPSLASVSTLLPRLELDLAIRHGLQQQQQQQQDLDPSLFATVAPFVPLQQQQVAAVLAQTAPVWYQQQGQSDLSVTLALADAWTGPRHVEYMQWKDTSGTATRNTVLLESVAVQGCKDLIRLVKPVLLNRIVEYCPRDDHGLLKLDWDVQTRQAVGRVCKGAIRQNGKQHDSADSCTQVCRFDIE